MASSQVGSAMSDATLLEGRLDTENLWRKAHTQGSAGDSGDSGDSQRQRRGSAGRQPGDGGRLSDEEVAAAIKRAAGELVCVGMTPPEYPVASLGPLATACEG